MMLDPRALEFLKNNQRQLDMDGCEVGVSRQALDELIAAYEALSTVTPAEVGGLWVPANPEHAKLGWSYDFEQTERIARAAYDSTGYDATMEVVEFVMAEADRRHRTALTTERAAHAEARKAHSTILAVLGNVEHRGGGPNAARMYADMLNDIREIARRALTGGKEDG